MKNVVRERDVLCIILKSKEKENAGLNNNISDLTYTIKDLTDKFNDLTGKNNELQEKYKNLIDENLSQTDQFNKTLKAKSDNETVEGRAMNRRTEIFLSPKLDELMQFLKK